MQTGISSIFNENTLQELKTLKQDGHITNSNIKECNSPYKQADCCVVGGGGLEMVAETAEVRG